jgi:cell division septal protein FtsQ
MNIYSDAKQVSRKKRIFRIKFYGIIFLVLLLVATVFYLIFYSPIFKIKNISIKNTNVLTEDEILNILRPVILSEKIGGFAGFENMISWPSGHIEVSDPVISDIDIKKNWFKRTIEINVNERQRFAIWCFLDGQTCYWIDKQGVLFADAPLTEGSLISVVSDLREQGLPLGSRIEEERFIKNLILVLENLNKNGLEAQKITFDDSLKELHVNSVEGPIMLFSIRFDSSKNIPLITSLNTKNIDYIDLTVENKIFYKTKK